MELSKITLEIFSKLEQKWLSHCECKKTRILSLDGGGTKGIIAAASLIHLEDHIQARTGESHSRIADFFDVLVGTRIGAVFAAMLTADDGNGRPLFTARNAITYLTEKHSQIKDSKILTLKDTWGAAMKEEDLARRPDPNDEAQPNSWPVVPTCRRLRSRHEQPDIRRRYSRLCITNGTSRPLMASKAYWFCHLSISSRRQLQPNGECSTQSVVDIVLDGVSETVDQMLRNAFCWNRMNYVRIKVNGCVTEDVMKERGAESLPFGEKRLLTETNGQRIDSIEGFVQRPVVSGKSNLPPSQCKEAAVSPPASGR
ncbi:hypothetical protein HHK36_012629 [Tetracentron sinense]|uniref:PNPLA domain-containing protein n=1 Tax=Tetracentron sinense TaxID=13715 RepID=A0A835DFN2_TETSI|nr:hypothetical protein HHK36_012629 [Tetracentron sinense]